MTAPLPGRRAETVLLLGMGPTALDALESLAARFRVLGVVRPLGRGFDPVPARAAELGVTVHTDCSPADVRVLVDTLRPDCVVVSSYDRILPDELVSGRPFVNVHYAPLPRYRGRATVNWAILRGEPYAVITVHRLVAGLDAGNILFTGRVPIGPHDTVGNLYDRLNTIQRDRLADTVARALDGYQGVPQDESRASYACTRLPVDGQIDWAAPTAQVDALVRAVADPYPGAFSYLDGRRLTVWVAEPVADPPRYEGRVPGRVVGRSEQDGHVDVLTGDGVLRLWQVQPDGSGRVHAASVIRSVRTTLGLSTVDLLDRVAALEATVRELTARLDGDRP
ncbi:MAG TPA: methionyl-tRNA formyltransferase [Mycobacteriales bacterium]